MTSNLNNNNDMELNNCSKLDNCNQCNDCMELKSDDDALVIVTDAIFSTYLVYCQRKGFEDNRVTDERLEQMLTELAALCEEYCVDALDVVTGKKLGGTQLQAIRDCDVMRKSDAVVTLDEVGL